MQRAVRSRFLFLVALAPLGVACGAAPPEPAEASIPDCHPVSGEQAMRLMLNGALLVDVSDRLDFYGRHLRGAHNIPLDELEDRLHELPRDRPIVVYSRDGEGAPEADALLRRAGFDVHLLGAFADWRS